MNILAIDTSTPVLGIALMQDGKIVAELITHSQKDHSSRLMPAIVDVMEKVNMSPEQLNKIVVANGPGSYTGTRIGVTTAKTMAWALDIPITTVSSLEALAFNGAHFSGYICPFFDARRRTAFTALYEWEFDTLVEVKPETNCPMEKWLQELSGLDKEVLFLSPDIDNFQESIAEVCPNAIIASKANHLINPAHLFTISENRTITPVHEVVPNYLRMTEAEVNWLKKQKDEQQDA